MRNILISILSILFFCQDLPAFKQKILVVQSCPFPPYEKAINGFESVVCQKTQRLIISELQDETVEEKITQINPDLILSVGLNAFSKIKHIKTIPIVYLMLLNPSSILSCSKKNITGVSMNISQEWQLRVIAEIFPAIQQVGILYDNEKTDFFVKRALKASQSSRVKIIAKNITISKEVPLAMAKMKERIDLFWMLPDVTVFTPETIDFLFLFSMENRIPVLTFSVNYLEWGALISIVIDASDMGRQAGEIAERIFSGTDVEDIKAMDARGKKIYINKKIAEKMGFSFDEKFIKKFKQNFGQSIELL